MTAKRTLTALFFGLALTLGCGGGDVGDNCEMEEDCGGDLLCAYSAVCPIGEPCPGVCGQPCAIDTDCEEGQMCGESTGGQRICQASRIGF